MQRWAGKVALVTGASSGIGAQVTRQLAENGMKVVAVARRLEKLQQLAASVKQECKGEVYPVQCDVRQEKDIINAFKWAEKELGGVDVLVNNAGVVSTQPIIEALAEEYHKIMDVSLIAMAICSRELVQSVKKRKVSGHIIIMNSLAEQCASYITVPLNLYACTHYAMTGMIESLRNEIKTAKLDIKVTSVCPAIALTDMTLQVIADADKMFPLLRVKDVADTVIYCIQTPPRVQIWKIIIAPNGLIISDIPSVTESLTQSLGKIN